MADFCFKDAYVMVNNEDLSNHVRSVSISYSAAELDDTCMGDNTHIRIAGLKDWSATIEFAQDFAASEVDATLFPLIGAAPFAIHIKPTSGAISTTNPDFWGNVILTDYPILDGSVGDLATTSVTFLAAGDIDRDITP